jgi:trk system potassium uptake protein TrkH
MGYGVSDFSHWPLFLPVFMMFISFVGSCGGSTAGGMKVMRITLLFKLEWREIIQLLHPRAIFLISFNVIDDDGIRSGASHFFFCGSNMHE